MTVSVRKTILALALVAIGLGVAGLYFGIAVPAEVGGERVRAPLAIARLFDLDSEANLPTWFASVLFLLIGMRNLFPRVLIPVLVPLITIPGSERLLSAPLEWITWPSTSLILGVFTFLLGWWALRQPPPHWAR